MVGHDSRAQLGYPFAIVDALLKHSLAIARSIADALHLSMQQATAVVNQIKFGGRARIGELLTGPKVDEDAHVRRVQHQPAPHVSLSQ